MSDRERIAEARRSLEVAMGCDTAETCKQWIKPALAALSTPEGETPTNWCHRCLRFVFPGHVCPVGPVEQQPDQVEAERRRLEDEYNRGYNQGFADARS